MLSGTAMRKHSPEYVTNWIKELYAEGIRFINIIDDNFTFDLEYAKDICRHIISLGLKDLSFGTPNGVRMQRGDTELWTLMKDAGWKAVCIAPESGSKRTLKRMKKGLNPDVIPGIVRDIKQAGLYVHAFFIIGYPGDTMEDLIDTRKLILNTDMDSFSLFIFQALPGTPVFDDLVRSGEITQAHVPTTESFFQIHSYRTPSLEGVNMKWFRFMTILMVYLKKPHKIIGLLKTQRLSFIRDSLAHMFFNNSAQTSTNAK
jgi:magnesium-protoporphyrin IX monomethyl ester (oxidative) cyclase